MEGCERLWVAIADVAYVQAGTALDPLRRSPRDVGLPAHTVLPMLPPKLADDLCSLRAGVIDWPWSSPWSWTKRTTLYTRAYEGVVHVSANIAYDDVFETDDYDDMLALAAVWQSREIRLNLNNPELRPRLQGARRTQGGRQMAQQSNPNDRVVHGRHQRIGWTSAG